MQITNARTSDRKTQGSNFYTNAAKRQMSFNLINFIDRRTEIVNKVNFPMKRASVSSRHPSWGRELHWISMLWTATETTSLSVAREKLRMNKWIKILGMTLETSGFPHKLAFLSLSNFSGVTLYVKTCRAYIHKNHFSFESYCQHFEALSFISLSVRKSAILICFTGNKELMIKHKTYASNHSNFEDPFRVFDDRSKQMLRESTITIKSTEVSLFRWR